MAPLLRVYAYLDKELIGVFAKWKPHRVFCTTSADHSDQPGGEFVVKFCQGRDGAAAMVSEVLCRGFLALGGISVLEAYTVEVSKNFADSWNLAPPPPGPIEAGIYFGTKFEEAAMPGPPTDVGQLRTPQEVVDVWAFDTWFCNLDRAEYGNTLLMPAGNDGKWQVIASDQSDCFCGATAFSDGSWKSRMRTRQQQEEGILLPQAIFSSGQKASVNAAIQKVRVAKAGFGAAAAQVPEEWWHHAQLDPQEIEAMLSFRLEQLPRILRPEQWEIEYGSQ